MVRRPVEAFMSMGPGNKSGATLVFSTSLDLVRALDSLSCSLSWSLVPVLVLVLIILLQEED